MQAEAETPIGPAGWGLITTRKGRSAFGRGRSAEGGHEDRPQHFLVYGWGQLIRSARSRRALRMTLTLESAMAAAAMIGESRSPKNG